MMHLYPLLLSALLAPSTGDLCFEDRGDLHGLQPLGGGIATIDFDGDGYQDLILGGGFGSGTLSLYHNVPGAAAGSRSFQDVTAGSGFSDADATGRDMSGIVVADVDGDGLDDVFASGYLPSAGPQPQSSGLFYRNLGGGVFANETVTRGMRATGYRMDSCTFVDYDHDGDVDLFGLCRSNPNNYLLLENDGTGQFTNNMAALPNAQYFFRAYSHLWTDIDGDGWEDCIVLVDGSAADLLRNDPAPGGGRMLTEVAASVGFAGLGMLPMGVACGDYDNDGDFDLAVSNANEGRYFENDGSGQFTAVTPITSVWGWGVTWFDAENDGDLDLYMACSYPTARSDRLFENIDAGASFVDRTSVLGLDDSMASRYSVGVDFDNDGFLDFVTVNPNQSGFLRPSVHKNLSTSTNDWIGLKLEGTGSTHSNALGAKVRVRAAGSDYWREVRSGSSTTSSEDRRLLVGLGAQAAVIDEVLVEWPVPGGRVSEVFGPFTSKTYHDIVRGNGTSPSTGTSFCTGTGTCTLCPCGNDAASNSPGGCLNSNGGSAQLVAEGNASLAADSLRFTVADATPMTFAILSSGDTRAPANASNPCFGLDTGIQSLAFDGLRCVVQNILRHGTRPTDSAGRVGTTTAGWGPPNAPTGGLLAANGFAAGQTRAFQVIYREDPMLGCGRGQNTTQGVEITFAP